MANGDNLDFLPPRLRAEIEKSADAQGRPVNDLLTEAVDRYLRDQQWAQVKSSMRLRARESGWTEDTVERAIADTRAERSR